MSLSTAGGPLPAWLAASESGERAGKRERTRRQILETACALFAERGVENVALIEVAERAGVSNGTFYNHFRTKQDLLAGLALLFADTLCRRIFESCMGIEDGARRMVVGNRRYVQFAAEHPGWAAMFMAVFAAAPELRSHIDAFVLEDLRIGIRQKRFRVASEAAALDLIGGACNQAMLRAVLGESPPGHDIAVATTVLRGLGMDFDAAAACARAPLPPLPVPDDAAPVVAATQKPRRTRA